MRSIASRYGAKVEAIEGHTVWFDIRGKTRKVSFATMFDRRYPQADLEGDLENAMRLLTSPPPRTGATSAARRAARWSPEDIERWYSLSPWVIQHGSYIDAITYEPVQSKEQLRRALLALGDEKDPNLELHHKAGNYLNVSVKGALAMVQFTREATDSAYLTPFEKNLSGDPGIEVDVGGTPTHFPRNRCVSVETMVAIALYWYEHEELPPWVTWKEV